MLNMNDPYIAAVAQQLQRRGVQPTEENIRKVLSSQRPQKPKEPPSAAEQIGLGVAGALGTGAATALGSSLGGSLAGTAGLGAATGTAAALGGTAAATAGTGAAAGGAGLAAGGAGAGAGGAGVAGLGAVALPAAAIGAALFGGYKLYDKYIADRGKDKYQEFRDDGIRDKWQDLGLIDENFMFNGTDVGFDGGFRFDDGRKIYEVMAGQEDDGIVWDDPNVSENVGALQALGALTVGGRDGNVGKMSLDELSGQATGMAYNALLENDGQITGDELRSVYDTIGGHGTVIEQIGELANIGKMSIEDAQALQNGVNQVYGREFVGRNDEGSELYNEYEAEQRTRDDFGDLLI